MNSIEFMVRDMSDGAAATIQQSITIAGTTRASNGIEFIVRDMLRPVTAMPLQTCTSQGVRIPPPRRKGDHLTVEQIIFILDMKGVITIRELQTMLEISRGAIANIWTGRDARAAKALKQMEAA